MSLGLKNSLTNLTTDWLTIYNNSSSFPMMVKMLISNTTTNVQSRVSIRIVKADTSTFNIMYGVNLLIGQAWDINIPIILEAGDRLEGIVLDAASYNGVCVAISGTEYQYMTGIEFDSNVAALTTSYATIYTCSASNGAIAKIAICNNSSTVEGQYSINIRVGGTTNRVIAESIYLAPNTTEFIECPIVLSQYDLIQVKKISSDADINAIVSVEVKTI